MEVIFRIELGEKTLSLIERFLQQQVPLPKISQKEVIAIKDEVVKEAKAKKQKDNPTSPASDPGDDLYPDMVDKVIASANGMAKTEPKYKFEEVRAAAVAKMQAAKKVEVKALLKEFGVEKTPELKPDQYDSFMDKLSQL